MLGMAETRSRTAGAKKRGKTKMPIEEYERHSQRHIEQLRRELNAIRDNKSLQYRRLYKMIGA
jgi:ribosomal protein L19E